MNACTTFALFFFLVKHYFALFTSNLTLIRKLCNEHGTIYAISSDFGDRMTTQSMGLMVLLSEYF